MPRSALAPPECSAPPSPLLVSHHLYRTHPPPIWYCQYTAMSVSNNLAVANISEKDKQMIISIYLAFLCLVYVFFNPYCVLRDGHRRLCALMCMKSLKEEPSTGWLYFLNSISGATSIALKRRLRHFFASLLACRSNSTLQTSTTINTTFVFKTNLSFVYIVCFTNLSFTHLISF